MRVDNPAERCLKCTARISGRLGGAVLAARANRVRCSGCGISFVRSLSTVRSENFCTLECKTRTRNVERRCAECGRQFNVYRSVVLGPTNATGKFCSLKCYHAWMLAGANVRPHYVQMKGRRRGKVVDGKICGRCGTGEDLQVHHIIPRRLDGPDEQSNLMPLCIRCHKTIECITSDLIVQGVPPSLLGEHIAAEVPFHAN